jgi:hypothetical protein
MRPDESLIINETWDTEGIIQKIDLQSLIHICCAIARKGKSSKEYDKQRNKILMSVALKKILMPGFGSRYGRFEFLYHRI